MKICLFGNTGAALKAGENRLVFATPPDTLLHGLGNVLEKLDTAIHEAGDAETRAVLTRQRIDCVMALEARQKPIEAHEREIADLEARLKSASTPDDQTELERQIEELKKARDAEVAEAGDQVRSDDSLIGRLDRDGFDHISVEILLSSDLRPFLDPKFVQELEKAAERMNTQDHTRAVLQQGSSLSNEGQKKWTEGHGAALAESAHEEWLSLKTDVENEIRKLNDELPRLKGKDQASRERRVEIRERVGLLQDQLKSKSRRAFQRRRFALLEKETVEGVKLNFPPELKERTKALIVEAKAMRVEAVKKYLWDRMQRVFVGFEGREDLFPPEQRKKIEKLKKEIEGQLNDNAIWSDPKTLQEIQSNLDAAEETLKESTSGLEAVKAGRPEIEKDIRKRFAAVKQKLAAFTPERVRAITEKYRQEEVARLKKEGSPPIREDAESLKAISPIFRKNIEALESSAELHGHVEEFEARIADFKDVDEAELQTMQEELVTLERTLGLGHPDLDSDFGEKMDQAADPARLETAQTARRVINSLKTATSIEDVREILEKEVGKEHVEFVPNSKFRAYPTEKGSKDLQQYTGGHMVFHEREKAGVSTWKIIVDEDGFKDPRNVKKLQKQLTHEFLHLEFERNDELKAEWKKMTAHPDWPAIKAAYVRWSNIPRKGSPAKKPPDYEGEEKSFYTVNDWKNEDVLSELYAMQEDLSRPAKPDDKSPFNKLRQLWRGAGFGALALGLTADTAEAKEIFRGYDGDNPEAVMDQAAAADKGAQAESADAVSGSYQRFEEQIDGNEKEIKEILQSEYLGYMPGSKEFLELVNRYNQNTREINQEFKKNGSPFLADQIPKRIEKVGDAVKKLNVQLAEAGAEIPNQKISVFRKMWLRTTVVSIDGVIKMFQDGKEYFKRRHDRKKGDHAAKLGMALAGKTALGHEFKAQEEHAQEEEVEAWKKRFATIDAWELKKIIKEMADNPIGAEKDKLKAILKILADKGRIDWRDENLWKVLNKLQGKVHLTPEDSVLLHNPTLLRQKLHAATGAIWHDYDLYNELERTNEDAYESGKKKFNPSLDRIQDQLTDRMKQLLRAHRNGHKVLGSEYESVIEYAIENGKSNAEAALFYLMMGIVEGILTPDRGMALDKHLNKWPATQWIYHKKPPLSRKDYEDTCIKYFKKEMDDGEIAGENSKFKNFYWTVVQNDTMTVQRVRKSVSERGWDHDWTRTVATLGDANTAKRFLSGKSGQQETKDTGVENAYVGVLQWLEENAKVAEKTDFRKNFTRQMSFATMMDGIVDYVAYNRGASDIYTRGNASMLGAIAREADVGNHANWTVQMHREKMRRFLSRFDAPLFQMLRDEKSAKADGKAHGEKVKNYLKARYNQPAEIDQWDSINSIDDVFDKMDFIIQTITSSRYISDAQFLANIKTLQRD